MLGQSGSADWHSVDTVELRILHALSVGGSLTSIADDLEMSQPAISQRIKRLESRIEVPVIERSGRGIRLTPAGKILAAHGAKVAAEIDSALDKIDALRGERGGELRLVGFPSASATVVPEMMRLLRKIAPGVVLQYREAEPPGALEMLREGEVDCAIIFDYADTTKLPAGADYTPLWREQLQLVVCEDDPRLLRSGTANLADFSDDHWIAGCEKCRGNLLAAAAEQGFTPDIVQETDNIPAMVAMVAAGDAVALVPDLALAQMRGLPDGARAVQLSPSRVRTVGFAAMRTATQSPQVKLAEKLLRQVPAGKWNLEQI